MYQIKFQFNTNAPKPPVNAVYNVLWILYSFIVINQECHYGHHNVSYDTTLSMDCGRLVPWQISNTFRQTVVFVYWDFLYEAMDSACKLYVLQAGGSSVSIWIVLFWILQGLQVEIESVLEDVTHQQIIFLRTICTILCIPLNTSCFFHISNVWKNLCSDSFFSKNCHFVEQTLTRILPWT